MPKSTAYASDVLNLFFNAASIANIAQNNATSPSTQNVFALHTADPTVTGTQTSSEISYTGYARTNVARTTGGFATTATGVISPVANIDFPASTGGTGGTVTFASIGSSPSTTANKIYMYGGVSPSIVVTSGVTPRLTTASTITET